MKFENIKLNAISLRHVPFYRYSKESFNNFPRRNSTMSAISWLQSLLKQMKQVERLHKPEPPFNKEESFLS